MWGMNTITTPMEIGARGLVKKGITECTNKIHGNIKIQKFQVCPPRNCLYPKEEFIYQTE